MLFILKFVINSLLIIANLQTIFLQQQIINDELVAVENFVKRDASTFDKSSATNHFIDIKIGFLVGSKRSKYNQFYSSPGKHLIRVFNYGINKINQLQLSINKQQDKQNSSKLMIQDDKQKQKIIRFIPIVAETFGNESESVKQTIDLITRKEVNFIVGPQETCQIESRLATMFNVPMISHYCTYSLLELNHDKNNVDNHDDIEPPQKSSPKTTFIQTKPPHWKIVKHVVTLIENLLLTSTKASSSPDNLSTTTRNNNKFWYPQNLVLLYFKESTQQQQQQQTNNFVNNDQTSSSMAIDALQYKIIGKLLEIELNDLFKTLAKKEIKTNKQPPLRRRSLDVLNWHTTFHYGYTKNPFRQLIRRHLFKHNSQQQQLRQAPAANNNNNNNNNNESHSICPSSSGAEATKQTIASNKSALPMQPAIYIVVGHYYEHLGLMLALNELNLLDDDDEQLQGSSSSSQKLQSSVMISAGNVDDNNSIKRRRRSRRRRSSIVIGVDIEQYDERDDSVRFLRGLLMDGGSGGNGGSIDNGGDNFNSIANMYRNYVGVVPAKPIRTEEFLEDMSVISRKNQSLQQQQQLSMPTINYAVELNNITSTTTTTKVTSTINHNLVNHTTLDSAQLMSRLFQFIRLPVEAFYLRESLTLIGAYFQDCFARQELTLKECSEGQRAFDWFRNRQFLSLVNNNWIRFDSNAQADGSYNLITRRRLITSTSPSNESFDFSTSSSSSGDYNAELIAEEFGLEPIGYFNGENNTINFTIDSSGQIDSIWLPLWCHLTQNDSCKFHHHLTTTNIDDVQIDEDMNNDSAAETETIIIIIIMLIVVLIIGAFLLLIKTLPGKAEIIEQKQSVNFGWFDANDERNFLKIIKQFLLTPESLLGNSLGDSFNDLELSANLVSSPSINKTSLIEVHCHMFPFPSCKFVHWLTALHKLKESMFQYQSSQMETAAAASSTAVKTSDHWLIEFIGEKFKNFRQKYLPTPSLISTSNSKRQGDTSKNLADFFRTKHKSTASLRLLLHKYKSVNECFCTLSNLNQQSIVSLFGVTLNCANTLDVNREQQQHQGIANNNIKVALLVLEQPDRGNLREAFKIIQDNLKDDYQASDTSDCISSKQTNLNTTNHNLFKTMAIASFIDDLLNALEYLHSSKIKFHGELRLTNCMLTSNLRLKLTGFHSHHLRRSLGDYELHHRNMFPTNANCNTNNEDEDEADEFQQFKDLLYSAPEVLRKYPRINTLSDNSMQLADIYSFAFIVYELLVGQEPWSCLTQVTNSKLLIERVKVDSSFRPPLARLSVESRQEVNNNKTCLNITVFEDHDDSAGFNLELAQQILKSCWSDSPNRRPQTIRILRDKLKPLVVYSGNASSSSSSDGTSASQEQKQQNMFNVGVNTEQDVVADYKVVDFVRKEKLFEFYTNLLERISNLNRETLFIEREKNLYLKHRMLPKSVIQRLEPFNKAISVSSNEKLVEMRNEKISNNSRLGKNSFFDYFECVSFCFFRIILVPILSAHNQTTTTTTLNINNKQQHHQVEENPLEKLNEILTELDNLIATYHDRLQLVESQVDSSMRHMVYSGGPTAASTLSGSGSGGELFDHTQLVASFALQLIDLVNRSWQSKFKSFSVQVKCALHCGPAMGGLLSTSSSAALTRFNPPTSSSSSCAVQQQTKGRSRGKAIAGGLTVSRYVLYGNSLQLADALEATSLPQRIQVSAEFRKQLLLCDNSKSLTSKKANKNTNLLNKLTTLSSSVGFHNVSAAAAASAAAATDVYGDQICDGADDDLARALGGLSRSSSSSFFEGRQGYVMIKREGKIHAKQVGSIEAFWLLNGPRLSASQSLRLLAATNQAS